MDSLKDLLLSKNLDQPSEMKSIQEYLNRELAFPFSLKDYQKHITIAVGNGKVGYMLRGMLPALEAYAAPTKVIHIRIDRNLGD
jgi:hypothetical protein